MEVVEVFGDTLSRPSYRMRKAKTTLDNKHVHISTIMLLQHTYCYEFKTAKPSPQRTQKRQVYQRFEQF